MVVLVARWLWPEAIERYYATALRDVLQCSQILPVERGHRVRARERIRSWLSEILEFRDPLNLGLTEHTTASHLGD